MDDPYTFIPFGARIPATSSIHRWMIFSTSMSPIWSAVSPRPPGIWDPSSILPIQMVNTRSTRTGPASTSRPLDLVEAAARPLALGQE